MADAAVRARFTEFGAEPMAGTLEGGSGGSSPRGRQVARHHHAGRHHDRAMSYLVGHRHRRHLHRLRDRRRAGRLLTTKVPSTPADFSRGMMDALGAGAQALGLGLVDSAATSPSSRTAPPSAPTPSFRSAAPRVGLITTRGHEDAIHIMRGSRGYGGRDIRKVVHFPETAKPQPIVPKRLIRGVSERVDCFGEIVVKLNEDEALAAIRDLVEQGVEAIAICFLWSFRNPAHELALKKMVERLAPSCVRHLLYDIAPKWGEYERVTATALNAYLGPVMSGYLQARHVVERPWLSPRTADHAMRRRHRAGRARRRSAAAHARLGAGIRRHGVHVPRRCDGRKERHHDRHGRHIVRRVDHLRRQARVLLREQHRSVRLLPAQGRPPGDRCRRGQPGSREAGSAHHDGRTGQRRRISRPRLLWARRHRADSHRCAARAGLPRPRQLRRRPHEAR